MRVRDQVLDVPSGTKEAGERQTQRTARAQSAGIAEESTKAASSFSTIAVYCILFARQDRPHRSLSLYRDKET